MPASLTENFFLAVETRLKLILTDSTYSLFGKLKSVQLKTYHFAGGERPETNTFGLDTIIVSDLGGEDVGDGTDDAVVDAWRRTVRGQCWYVSTDGDLLSMIRAYEDMLRALNPAELPRFTLARYGRSYKDPFTEESLPGVILDFQGVYQSSLTDPSVE